MGHGPRIFALVHQQLRQAVRWPIQRSLFSVTLCASLITLATLAAQQLPPPGADPSGPKWNRILKLSDGRTFVTDGGMAIDATLAKPATLPSQVASSKVLEGYMNAEAPTEVGLLDLSKGLGAKNYSAPNDVTLNPIYIDYLRRTLPGRRVKLRIKGNRDPIAILMDGKPVGVLMPLAPAKK
jgi:hypothetical protein